MSESLPPPQTKPAKRLNYKERYKAGLVAKKPQQRVRAVSKKLAPQLARYREWIKTAMHGSARCEKCNRHCPSSLQAHHPYGRSGDNLFKVIPLCAECHEWVHTYPSKAMLLGWLQPEIWGLKSDPHRPPPFNLLPNDKPSQP